ncbi:methyltransferase domain-containing protein [Natronococcus wangiae]|uniref:methyltransferase domain-containing protein n=1 Tax=Natronococcus wangiae TaxID=3068275 RepID=UPI00273DD84F|nr:methyltransferase domain-containing protein [Natronococcus sp. AD5]
MSTTVNERELENRVKEIYRDVADEPDEEFHFEMGRGLAERLGYSPTELDRIPQEAVDSFAGVGYHVDLADLTEGDRVLDLGSGSGTDAFVAALRVGDGGHVIGLDMTDEQLAKSRRLRDEAGVPNVSFEKGYIEELPFEDGTIDAVLSNGVINLSAKKERVFEEVSRVLVPGGRLAISDIISERQMPERIKGDADLWAACIGGAMQIDDYTDVIEMPGFADVEVRENPQYEFVSERAQGACQAYGVKSISLRARNR